MQERETKVGDRVSIDLSDARLAPCSECGATILVFPEGFGCPNCEASIWARDDD